MCKFVGIGDLFGQTWNQMAKILGTLGGDDDGAGEDEGDGEDGGGDLTQT